MRTHRRNITASDGTRVAWDVAGTGEPPLLLCNGLITNTIFWRDMLPVLERRHRVLTWDLKGHGDSGPARTVEGASVEAAARDALAVMDAAGVGSAVVGGYSMGCQVALEIHRQAPERVQGLALILGPAGPVFEHAFGPFGRVLAILTRATPPHVLMAALGVLGRLAGPPFGHWFATTLGFIGPTLRPADFAGILAHWRQLDGPTVRNLALSAGTYDARPHLSLVKVPTLIVAGDRDVFAPARKVALPMHAAIAGSRLVRLPHGTHSSTLEHAAEVQEAVERFLDLFRVAPAYTATAATAPDAARREVPQ